MCTSTGSYTHACTHTHSLTHTLTHTLTHIHTLTHVGVCQVDPEVIDFEDIEEMTDLVGLPYWILSGSDLHCEDSAPESDYPLNLDAVPEGSKIGLNVTLDGDLHFFINGVDMGVAAAGLPTEGEDLALLNSDSTGVLLFCLTGSQ